MSTSALERLVARGPSARRSDPGCELCTAPVDGSHRHLWGAEESDVMCVCRPCALLFDRDAASLGRYRLIPTRRLRLEGLSAAGLGVPVGLAYFVRRDDGTVGAHYPSPAGATRWDIDPAAWSEATRASPALETLAPHVEALLVNTVNGQRSAWLVPVDDCYRLVATVMREWRGLSGGDQVWPAVTTFFAELREST